MKVVKLLITKDDDTQRVLGRFKLVDDSNTVVFEGAAPLKPTEIAWEAPDITDPKITMLDKNYRDLTPADGLKYLEALHIHFSGTRVRASKVMEEIE